MQLHDMTNLSDGRLKRIYKGVATVALCLIGASGCADVVSTPAKLNATSHAEDNYVMASSVDVGPIGGQSRTLNENSIWAAVGSITDGEVYRPLAGSLTAEA